MRDDVDPVGDHSVAAATTDTYTILPGDLVRGALLLCDHARNGFPARYGTLGLPAHELERHIAYDIGAAAVTRHLSNALGLPAVLSHYSRLLIDLNRGEDDPTLIMRISDGAIVPGNRRLDAAEREARIARYYRPYHGAIDALIDCGIAAGIPPALISIHSFTDNWRGTPRPWHVGILWDRDDRISAPLISALARDPGMVVGDNEPYCGHLQGDCLWQHGTERGLAHVLIELRQDLIASESGQKGWADRLARILGDLLTCPERRPELRTIRHYGSMSDTPAR